ncbi:MAG: DUF4411 family protein [Pseudonocardiaceae bacterium]
MCGWSRFGFLAKTDYYLAGQAATLGYTMVTQETSDSTSKKRVKIHLDADALPRECGASEPDVT